MRSIWFFASLVIVLSQSVNAQTPILTDYLLYPRLYTAYWFVDFEQLNADYSRVANQCQTCITSRTDTTRTRSCFNTSRAHVRLDTTFHNLKSENLIGEWRGINAGVIEVADSLAINAPEYGRVQKIIADHGDGQGQITFTNKVMKGDIKFGGKRLKRRKRYVIIEGRHLMTKKLIGLCGPIMIGLIDDRLLILDLLSYEEIVKRDEYFVFRTIINRTILERKE